MSTCAVNNKISTRKQHHIDVCRQDSGKKISGSVDTGFSALKFIHTALPELAFHEIDTEVLFLNKTIALPLFISSMTGGSEEGYRANRELAKAAQRMNLPMGLGSMRVLLESPERLKDFRMKQFAPDILLMANLGAVQVRDIPMATVSELVKSVEADALIVHLNCGQELFQKGGDLDFRGLFDAIARLCDTLSCAVIVKETGFGIRPAHVQKLLDLGVTYVDLAGAGGTNWILVEKECHESLDENDVASEFASWGIPTAALLATTHSFEGRILASGGLRSGMDLAKSLALGAVAGGIALPFFQVALDHREEGVCQKIKDIAYVLRSVLLMTGCKSIAQLRNTQLLRTVAFEQLVQSLQQIDHVQNKHTTSLS